MFNDSASRRGDAGVMFSREAAEPRSVLFSDDSDIFKNKNVLNPEFTSPCSGLPAKKQ